LTGTWLTTLAFAGRRPVQAVITFLETAAGPGEHLGEGSWIRASADKFLIAFRVPVDGLEADAGFEYRLTGIFALDEALGRLRGPVVGEVLDPTGKVVASLHGAAKLTRIASQEDRNHLVFGKAQCGAHRLSPGQQWRRNQVRKEMPMKQRRFARSLGTFIAFAGLPVAAVTVRPARLKADDDGEEDSKVQQAFAIAPAPLNLEGKDRNLAGLGSYFVNTQSDCNGCRSLIPAAAFIPARNPYLLPQIFTAKKQVNPAVYLGGGRGFGPLGTGANPGCQIISRNLTPDKTGRPEGGRSFAEFLQIVGTGVDLDHLHPNPCSVTAPQIVFSFHSMGPSCKSGHGPSSRI
jgi:hypothetical protein